MATEKALVVDDHPAIRMVLRGLLEKHGFSQIEETDNGVDAIDMARSLAPDLIILDIGIPRLDGLEVIERLMTSGNNVKILVFTQYSPDNMASRCLLSGAVGYVCKRHDLNEVSKAIAAVRSGFTYFPQMGKNAVTSNSVTDEQLLSLQLSSREMMVWMMLVEGLSNKQIGDRMLLSNKTISTYKMRLFEKFNVTSVIGLADIAKRHGLL